MQKLSRRDALRGTGVAALAAGLAVVPFAAARADGPSELAELIRLYWQQSDEFESYPDHLSVDEIRTLAERTYMRALDRCVGVPARTRQDAYAAIDYIVREGEHSMIEMGDHSVFSRASESFLLAVRDYLAEEVRS